VIVNKGKLTIQSLGVHITLCDEIVQECTRQYWICAKFSILISNLLKLKKIEHAML